LSSGFKWAKLFGIYFAFAVGVHPLNKEVMIPCGRILGFVDWHFELDFLVLSDLNWRDVSQSVLGLTNITNRWTNIGDNRCFAQFVGLQFQGVFQHKR